MGKVNKSNFRKELGDKTNRLTDHTTYYVDKNTGDDKNKGTTAGTALKTIAAATGKLNAKVGGYVRILIRSGVYNEPLMVYDYTGSLTVSPIDSGEGKITINGTSLTSEKVGIFSPCYLVNSTANITIENVNFNFEGMTQEHKDKKSPLIYLQSCPKASFVSCIFDGTILHAPSTDRKYPTGIYAFLGSGATVTQCVFINLGIPISAVRSSEIKTSLNKFTNITDGYYCEVGCIVTGNTSTIDNISIFKATAIGSYGISSIDDLNYGVVMESGINENGSYTKFADGTLLMYGKKHLDTGAFIANSISGIFTREATITLPARGISGADQNLQTSVKRGSSVCWSTLHPRYDDATASVYVLCIGDPAKASNPTSEFIIMYQYQGRWK